MSKLTKQHFESAAEDIRTSYKLRSRREKNLVQEFLCEWFKHWNPEFDAQRFRDACSDSLKPRKGLKKAIAKYKTREQVLTSRPAMVYKCARCDQEFLTQSGLDAHETTHRKRACDFCGREIPWGHGYTIKRSELKAPFIGTPKTLLSCSDCYSDAIAQRTPVIHPKDIDDGRVDDRPDENERRGLCTHGAPYAGMYCNLCKQGCP